jgi:rhamnulose-1-phosphate aldolase/alcohol dehydrogenase
VFSDFSDAFDSRWDDAHADSLDGLGRLVYRSRLLGADPRITNTGGGNTSSKLMETDPLTGEVVDVLWVKGSGGDLRTATRGLFSSLYLDKLLGLQKVYAAAGPSGPKTPLEDSMVALFAQTTFNLNPRAPSIDTPLHGFVPYRHVDHTHPIPVIALATAADGPRITQEVYGDEVIWVDWMRPGFELGLALQEVCARHPNAKGVLMGGHGLINWADDDKACYELSLRLIGQAADFLARHDKGEAAFGGRVVEDMAEAEREALLVDLLPWLRGRVSRQKRMIGTVHADAATLDFIASKDAARLAECGTSCPDHFLRTKIKPLYADWTPDQGLDALKTSLDASIAQYGRDYAEYYEAHKHPDSPAMRGAEPTVVLIPGVGMIAWGKTKSESRTTAEFYRAAIGVMRGAEAVSTYAPIARQEAFDIEYWLLEEAKLKRMPPEQEMSRRIAVVVGAGSGIGRVLVERLLKEGATVAALDLNADAAEGVAKAIMDRIGMGIGVAGTGISGAGDVIGLGCDVTDRASVRAALSRVVLAYGGFDAVAMTAGLYVSPDTSGRIPDAAWARTFSVNVTGGFLLADEAERIWRAQNLPGSLVLTTSVNAAVAKKGSFAYDTSKAAANHLVRELAVALAPLVRVNGVAPATVVEGSSMFPRARVIASLAKYGLPHADDESDDALRSRLAQFYADRTLTRQPITPADQAEAIYLLLSDRLGKTTGQVISVDGGLTEAFLR